MPEVKDLRYYSSKEINSVLEELSTKKTGLSHEEAEERIREYGHNILVEKKENFLIRFLSHFKSPLILLLLAAAVIAFFSQEVTEAIIIVGITLVGVSLDFTQEYSANKALKKLTESVEVTAAVIRGGKKKEISIKNLVVGDVIFLSAGDIVPADARIIETENLFVNQASITGESFPAEKNSEKISLSKTVLDLNNILFSGTTIVGGSGTAVIVKTGKATEFGKIVAKIAGAPANQ